MDVNVPVNVSIHIGDIAIDVCAVEVVTVDVSPIDIGAADVTPVDVGAVEIAHRSVLYPRLHVTAATRYTAAAPRYTADTPTAATTPSLSLCRSQPQSTDKENDQVYACSPHTSLTLRP